MPLASQEHAFDSALSLLAESGLSGVTIRSVASRGGVSPSSLIYHFGTREAFLAELLKLTARKNAEFWRVRTDDLLNAPLRITDLSALARSVLIDQAVSTRGLMLAHWEFELAAGTQAGFREDIRAIREEDLAFWAKCFALMGLPTGLSVGWACGLIAIGRLLVISPPTPAVLAWADDAVTRMSERLTGSSVSRPGDSLWRQAAEKGLGGSASYPDDLNTTPARIVKAASEQILHAGCASLSHRSVASRAGVSLSSMTHHFQSIEEILIMAFWKIYQDARERAVLVPEGGKRYSKAAFIEDILPALEGYKVRGRAALNAFEDIILTTARRPHMRDMSLALFAMTGSTSQHLLAAITDAENLSDRLDAHIFRLVMSGFKSLDVSEHSGIVNEDMKAFLYAYL